MRPWRSLGVFRMRQASTQTGYSSRSKDTRSWIQRCVELLDGLTVILDSQSVTESVSNILPIAREYGLSAYDAAYLDVAVRHTVPRATLDSALQKAGRKAGIQIFKGNVARE